MSSLQEGNGPFEFGKKVNWMWKQTVPPKFHRDSLSTDSVQEYLPDSDKTNQPRESRYEKESSDDPLGSSIVMYGCSDSSTSPMSEADTLIGSKGTLRFAPSAMINSLAFSASRSGMGTTWGH